MRSRPSNPSECRSALFGSRLKDDEIVELEACARFETSQDLVERLGRGASVYMNFEPDSTLGLEDRFRMVGESLSSLCSGCKVGAPIMAVPSPTFGQLVGDGYVS